MGSSAAPVPLDDSAATRADEADRPGGPSGAAASAPIRVCVVAPGPPWVGGQVVQSQRLMAHLRTLPEFDVDFVPHNPQFRGPFARLQRIKYVRTVTTTAAYLGLLLARLRRADVVHVFSASYWSYLLGPMLALLVGRLYGKPVILNYRSGECEDHLETWPRAITGTMALATIITPTPYLTEVFARFGFTADVIPNYLDLEQLTYRVRDPLRPVFLVNRLFEPLYNYPCALEAFRLVQAEVPEARLIVAGFGPLEGDIRRWIAEKQLRHVDFRGRVTQAEMRQLYHEADVYLNAPNLDCFPGSILEAFATGIPVVTANAGGIRYIVAHERTGLMVDCDDAAGLARCAIRMVREPDAARRMAAAGRAELEARYVWPVVGPAWLATYRRLAGGAAARAG